MKKLAILALIMLLPAVVMAEEGDPGFFTPPTGIQYIYPGEEIVLTPGPANFGFVSTLCTETDTFCIHPTDTAGWTLLSSGETASPCDFLEPGSYFPDWPVSVICPCEAQIGDLNLVTIQMAYCTSDGWCRPEIPDCEEPNIYNELEYSSFVHLVFEVVEAPPALFILQDSMFAVEEGVVAAYIPFSICNGDPCAPATDYNYLITSLGTVGGAISQTGTAVGILGGECADVYGLINASLATACEWDTLTILVWDLSGTVYDTCVQAVHIIEPIPVPLFTAPVVTILVLAMILAAAVIMKRHAVSKA